MNNDLMILKKLAQIEKLLEKKFESKEMDYKIQFNETELKVSWTKK